MTSEATFRGIKISYEMAHQALRDFATEHPDSDNGEWLEKNGYKYVIKFDGRQYPAKDILHIITKIPKNNFRSSKQINQIFQQLGFVVEEMVVASPSTFSNTEFITYLLTWNPKKFDWSFEEDWNNFLVGHRPRIRWSCGNTKNIKIDDRIFLMSLETVMDFGKLEG